MNPGLPRNKPKYIPVYGSGHVSVAAEKLHNQSIRICGVARDASGQQASPGTENATQSFRAKDEQYCYNIAGVMNEVASSQVVSDVTQVFELTSSYEMFPGYEDYTECSLEFKMLGLRLRINTDLVGELETLSRTGNVPCTSHWDYPFFR